ncbi:type IV pilus biogenesis/stability protein PilW [Thermomonas aquatica]|uniref:Type IV pilus biogenesis/stability protein PilW n=1 Tax=Thermomonas aquatica TaxID=2202149 RepID=A0A5B7ZL36_9GAMM|nr:type IV pilus biogenesis/stability protein PilW [Thermomonas aquatica]QDA55934.1 type IV pilus biogenesis/stability protein PilW [Thermomonas aquatica]
MRRKALALVACAVLLAAGCSRLERLSIIRPTAARGDYTQVAPTYEVSDKGRKGAPVAVSQLLANATGLYRAGRMDEAERLARQALKADARSGDAHTLLAAIATARGNAAEAGSHYQQAVAIAPANGAYANNYGTWLCGNGRAAESLDWFDKALADPGYPTPAAALANAGACADSAGQQDRAEAQWRQALALEPGNLPSLSGMAALQFARGQYLEARAFAERWLALAPTDAEGLQLAARIEQKLGDNLAAERYLSRLEAISPGSTTAPRTQ